MRLNGAGEVVLEAGEVRVLALALPLAAQVLRQRDRSPDPRVERLAYDAAVLAGGLGATVVASVTSISEAPSVAGRRCSDCGDEVFAALRRGRCDKCRKRAARAG